MRPPNWPRTLAASKISFVLPEGLNRAARTRDYNVQPIRSGGAWMWLSGPAFDACRPCTARLPQFGHDGCALTNVQVGPPVTLAKNTRCHAGNRAPQ